MDIMEPKAFDSVTIYDVTVILREFQLKSHENVLTSKLQQSTASFQSKMKWKYCTMKQLFNELIA